MWKGNHIWERMMEQNTGIAVSAPYQTIVEISGSRKILIENHQGVITYDKENVIIKVQYGTVTVSGGNLEIMHMSKEQVVICGNIANISLHRRERC